jgi:hypothetical protein
LAIARLAPRGHFFTFQDPLHYREVGALAKAFSHAAYLSWRLFQRDVVRGVARRLRRRAGIYLQDSVHDNVEYHVTRDGVDHNGIRQLLVEAGFDCDIITYFSTQSSLFQPLGTALNVKNTFAVVACRRLSRSQ